MTVESTAAIIRYTGDGADTVFPYTWTILDDDDIQVYLRVIASGAETLQTKDTHYTVSGVGLAAGGNITFITSPTDYTPTALEQVVLKRVPAITQTTDYEEGGEFGQEANEKALDRQAMISQMLKEIMDRALLMDPTSTYSELTLPDPVDGKLLAWNGALTGLENVSLTSSGTLAVTAFVETLLDDATAAAFLTTLGFSAFVQTILNDADAAAVLVTLGLDADLATFDLPASTTISAFIKTLLDDASAEAAKTTLGVLRRSYLAGLGMSHDTDTDHDILVAEGEARDAGNSVDIILAAALAKQIDATWAAGDDAGGMNDTDHPVGNDTWYHVFLLSDATGATVDVGFDTSVTAANLLADVAAVAAGHTKYRRIGSVLTDGSANIVQFFQSGDRFWLDVGVEDYDIANPGTSRVTTALSVPLGIQVVAQITCTIAYNAAGYTLFASPGQTDTAPGDGSWTIRNYNNAAYQGRVLGVLTDTSSQICFRCSAASMGTKILTEGWIDSRGKDS